MKKKTVNTYFVFKACSLCSLFFENRYHYVNEVLVYIKTILYIINGHIEIVGILLARIKIYATSEKLSGYYTY